MNAIRVIREAYNWFIKPAAAAFGKAVLKACAIIAGALLALSIYATQVSPAIDHGVEAVKTTAQAIENCASMSR